LLQRRGSLNAAQEELEGVFQRIEKGIRHVLKKPADYGMFDGTDEDGAGKVGVEIFPK
jgi:hypothetical protein